MTQSETRATEYTLWTKPYSEWTKLEPCGPLSPEQSDELKRLLEETKAELEKLLNAAKGMRDAAIKRAEKADQQLAEAQAQVADLRQFNDGVSDQLRKANEAIAALLEQPKAVAWMWEHVRVEGVVLDRGLSFHPVAPTNNAYWHSKPEDVVATRVTKLYAAQPEAAPTDAKAIMAAVESMARTGATATHLVELLRGYFMAAPPASPPAWIAVQLVRKGLQLAEDEVGDESSRDAISSLMKLTDEQLAQFANITPPSGEGK